MPQLHTQGTKLTFRPRRRSTNDEKEFKGKPRKVPELSIDESHSDAEIAADIANKLKEERDDLISKCVQNCIAKL